MSDTAQEQRDFMLKSWKLLNLQSDTLLKLAQARAVPWQLVTGGATAGAALLAAGFTLARLLA
jgi:hypothetical protein